MTNVNLRPNYATIDGILFPPFPPDHVRECLDYKPKPDDVFIATYPKCGTTWMQNMALYIFRKGRELEDHEEFHTCCPFVDCKGLRSIENMPRPGALKTHLPFTHVPYSPDAKYIYVLRNPKDCCVSLYYHTTRAHHGVYGQATFGDFFELFMAGEVEYNDYFDHLMSWYPHRNDKQVFFTTYEDMKRDARDVVLKLAAFLGQEYIDAIEKDNGVLNNVLRFSGFEYMKEHLSGVFTRGPRCNSAENSNIVREEHLEKPIVQLPNKETAKFFRKGIVGDWKNHFTAEQSERMDKKYTERLQGTDIYDMYKSYMIA